MTIRKYPLEIPMPFFVPTRSMYRHFVIFLNICKSNILKQNTNSMTESEQSEGQCMKYGLLIMNKMDHNVNANILFVYKHLSVRQTENSQLKANAMHFSHILVQYSFVH